MMPRMVACGILGCCKTMAKSSAYERRSVFRDEGRSLWKNMLKRVGESRSHGDFIEELFSGG